MLKDEYAWQLKSTYRKASLHSEKKIALFCCIIKSSELTVAHLLPKTGNSLSRGAGEQHLSKHLAAKCKTPWPPNTQNRPRLLSRKFLVSLPIGAAQLLKYRVSTSNTSGPLRLNSWVILTQVGEQRTGPGRRAVKTRRYCRYSSNLLCSGERRVWVSALNLIIFEKNTKATFCGLLTFLQLWHSQRQERSIFQHSY